MSHSHCKLITSKSICNLIPPSTTIFFPLSSQGVILDDSQSVILSPKVTSIAFLSINEPIIYELSSAAVYPSAHLPMGEEEQQGNVAWSLWQNLLQPRPSDLSKPLVPSARCQWCHLWG